jgi:membrane protein implicated in regulation of membrane protease activity
MLGPNLVTIWFSIAAFIMSPLSLLNWPIGIQVIVFIVLSIALMLPLKKLYETKIKPQNIMKDNIKDKMQYQTGIVTKTIDNSKNEGQIVIGDIHWNATAIEDEIIEKDAKVFVEKIENMQAHVRKI